MLLRRGPIGKDQISADKQTSSPLAFAHAPVLTRRDLVVLFVLTVLFLSNVTGVQFGGPVTFLYWVLGLLTFLLPCAYITQWLAKRFPGSGAPYHWATQILGGEWGFFATFCTWVPGLLVVVSATQASLSFLQYLFPTWFTTPEQQGLALIVLITITAAIACLSLRRLRWLLLAVTALYLGVFALLGGTGVWWLVSGHQARVAFHLASAWQPSTGNLGVYGLIILALLGGNLPWALGGEIRGGPAGARQATSFVWWGALLTFGAYLAGTFGVMCMLSPAQAGDPMAPIHVLTVIYGPFVGTIAAIIIMLGYLASACAYLLMFSRLLVSAAHYRSLPSALARLDRRGVPRLSIFIQAAAAITITIIASILVPSLFHGLVSPANLSQEIYSVLMAGISALLTFATDLLFVCVLWILWRRPHLAVTTLRERGMLIGAALIGMLSSGLGIWATFTSSWLPQLIADPLWRLLVSSTVLGAIALGWLGSELPRMRVMLSEQRQMTSNEIALRQELEGLYQEQALAAVTDAITGLPNHRAIMSRLDEALAHDQATGETCAVIFVDLDHFKHINDTWGHRAGDQLLREVGQRLHQGIRSQDLVGRYGGEEFALVLCNMDLLQATQTAEQLRSALASEPYLWQREGDTSALPIEASGSFGLALSGLHGVTKNALLEAADQAMYVAKHAGRNRVSIADVTDDMSKLVEERLESAHAALDEERRPQEAVSAPTIRALSALAVIHDRSTSAHAYRMTLLTEATARALECSEEEVSLFRLGALFHDIGKIGIPEAILQKAGPLSEEEWQVMRQHPLLGQQVLEHIGGVFVSLSDLVVAHHERWDGKGYPHALVGAAIPLGARILAVVDSYDAMISERPYRHPLSEQEATDELRRGAGSQYDPRVVEGFLQVLKKPTMHAKNPMRMESPTDEAALPHENLPLSVPCHLSLPKIHWRCYESTSVLTTSGQTSTQALYV